MPEQFVEVMLTIPWELYQELRLVWAEERQSGDCTLEFSDWLLDLAKYATEDEREAMRNEQAAD
jgi:hypothetical protein